MHVKFKCSTYFFAIIFMLFACGGGSGNSSSPSPSPPPANNVTVSLNSASVLVLDGLTFQFSANVVNATDTAVNWSVTEGATGGSINAEGLYTAPDTAGVYHVKATSKQNSQATATATVTVTKISVTADKLNFDIGEGETTQFSASVSAAQNTALNWVMVESDFQNALSSTGEFLAPDTAGIYAVRAYSVEDDRKFAEFHIQVHIKSAESSYVNWKESGVIPTKLPVNAQAAIKAYGDFTGDGKLDLVTSWLTYWDERFDSGEKTIDEATPATLNLWLYQADGTYVETHNIFPADIGCIHPRKMLVADFNLDGMSDIFVACHGWDKTPFPGEKNRIILSNNGSYIVQEASDDIGFYHGASAADLNSDGYPDVVLTDNFDENASISFFINDKTGHFAQSYDLVPAGLTGSGRGYFTAELVDVDNDGWLDLLLGGHEWENAPTKLYINPKTNNFSQVAPITLPSIPRDQVVVDFTVTQYNEVTQIWLARTTGSADSERFYKTFSIQKISWPTLESETVFSADPHQWFLALFPYELGGDSLVGLDDTNYNVKVSTLGHQPAPIVASELNGMSLSVFGADAPHEFEQTLHFSENGTFISNQNKTGSWAVAKGILTLLWEGGSSTTIIANSYNQATSEYQISWTNFGEVSKHFTLYAIATDEYKLSAADLTGTNHFLVFYHQEECGPGWLIEELAFLTGTSYRLDLCYQTQDEFGDYTVDENGIINIQFGMNGSEDIQRIGYNSSLQVWLLCWNEPDVLCANDELAYTFATKEQAESYANERNGLMGN